MVDCSICSERACLVCKEESLCLRHFVGKQDKGEVAPFVFSQDALNNQTPLVKDLWNDAIAEVVLRMFELQKAEEDTLRKDPLAILAQNKSSTKKALKQQFGESDFFIKSLESQQPKQPKLMAPRGGGVGVTDFQRGFSLLSGASSSATELTQQIKEIEAKSRAEADGDPCRVCGSKWTTTTHTSSYDIGKSEVWGNKDGGETVTVTCRDCFHREVQKIY